MVPWDVIGQDLAIIAALLVLEATLSFDNAAALAALVRRLPVKDRRKALLYGLVGAYGLRFAAIGFAAFLIQTPILKVLGGAYLVYVGLRHFAQMWRDRRRLAALEAAGPDAPTHGDPKLRFGFLARIGVPPLVIVIIQIELLDLAFAIDQVIVAVAFTDKLYLIFIAAGMGILFLRLAASYLVRVMDWLPVLEHMAFIVVTIVGAKLMLLYWDIHVPAVFSISLTLGVFLIPVFLKLLFGIPRSATGQSAERVQSSASSDAQDPGTKP